jgi:(p)ppGpp synthase/HD superfamily hydrolase
MKLAEQTLEHWIELMRKIAWKAHEGQTRNDGSPYIHHPERVAAAVEQRLKPIALGHDLCEDTDVTIEYLMKAGFPLYIIRAIDVLTHRNKEPNLQYWGRIKQNPDALAVKLADINDNINDKPSEKAKAKYALALKFFAES